MSPTNVGALPDFNYPPSVLLAGNEGAFNGLGSGVSMVNNFMPQYRDVIPSRTSQTPYFLLVFDNRAALDDRQKAIFDYVKYADALSSQTGLNTSSLPESIGSNWHLLHEASFSDTTHDRVLYLASHKKGWRGINSMPLNAGSLENFLRFWIRIKDAAKEPEIVLCANGNIQAEWFKSNNKSLFIEFKPDDKSAVYSLTDSNSESDGVESIQNLTKMLSARKNNPFKWCYD